jgi:serine/threonine protein kinase
MGAFGVVWLAREDRTGRMVAIKFYPRQRGMNWTLLSREVEKLAAVYTSHHIVRLLDVGWTADPPYFIMEYVEGGSLTARLADQPLSLEQSVRITREICCALVDAHGAGVLHCDLKPDNVLLDGQGSVRLCDFGQARMSHENSPALGTLYYMAPEQADLESPPDARWDVYAVGAILYQMLTGAPPHRSPEIESRLQNLGSLEERLATYRRLVLANSRPSGQRGLPTADQRLLEILDRCLAIDPAQRFPNAQAILEALDARDRQRSRRPLLLVGFLVPLLLTAALLPILGYALSRNRDTAEQQMSERALESDALSARLQAAALEDELQQRLQELETIAAGIELRRELEALMQRPLPEVITEVRQLAEAPLETRPRWMQLLDTAWERSREAAGATKRGDDTSWFLTDVTGTQIWRREYSERTIGENFAHRDYFHGLGVNFERGQQATPRSPLQKPHVSAAYKSTTTDRQTVAFSVPLFSADGQIIGVFARTVHLGDLQARLRGRMSAAGENSVERIIALAEVLDARQIRLLDHPCLTEQFLRTQENQAQDEALFRELTLDPDVASRIQTMLRNTSEIREAKLSLYRDPVGRIQSPVAQPWAGDWMAAVAPVNGTRWAVIVQERRSGVLAPIQQMERNARRQLALAAATAAGLIVIVWMFVWRAVMGGRA